MPGFSTKEQVTDVSGRGVGMDVVRTNITALQGNVEIDTELGGGTCFRIVLPLTLAIIDSMIVLSGNDRFIIPLSQITEFVKPKEQDINKFFDRDEVLTIRDEPLGIFYLSQLLGKPLTKEERVPSSKIALVIRNNNRQGVAVLVDKIVAQQQVVIKPIGPEVRNRTGLMGSAILGDGKPSLILDLTELIKSKNGFKDTHGKSNLHVV
jgi:two-component system chemotaxis sensor kinase CheA